VLRAPSLFVSLLLIAVTAFGGCGSAQRRAGSAPGEPEVDVRKLEQRPRLTLVERDGDPYGGVAFAAVHDFGPAASRSLAALLKSRLVRAGRSDVRVFGHALGIWVQDYARDPHSAEAFLAALYRASSSTVTAAEMPELERELELFPEPEADACGAAGAAEARASLTPESLERYRRETFATHSASVAAVGSEALLRAFERALMEQPAWGDGRAPGDPWPGADTSEIAPRKAGALDLTLGVRTRSMARAAVAARSLGSARSALRERLEAIGARLRLERVSAIARPRGACLRVEVARPGSGDVSPEQAGAAAEIVLDEMRRTLGRHRDGDYRRSQSILGPSDPGVAAGVAAWLSLSDAANATKEPVRVVWHSSDPPSPALRAAFDGARAAQRRAELGLDVRTRVERGQAEVWALLATPCGTLLDGSTPGTAALLMHALAAADDGSVRFEPWVTPDAVGVVAHAARRGAESPSSQVRRLLHALGRRVAVRAVSRDALARARGTLLHNLGPAPQPGWELVLDALAPGHASLLEPRGTWTALSEIGPDQVEALRQRFLVGPLRLALIVNHDRGQVAEGTAALQRWLGPLRGEVAACPGRPVLEPRFGAFGVPREQTERSFIAVLVDGDEARYQPELEATVLLLNQSGGWLEQAIERPGLASSARSYPLGGRRLAALAIEVQAEPEAMSNAVAQVRALLERLSHGAATRADAAWAQRLLETIGDRALVDPRLRLVRTWRGGGAPAEVDFDRLRRLHQALGGEKLVVLEPAATAP